MSDSMQKIGRLAMRQEGDRWNAYYALPNTMDRALFLGSIVMAAVVNSPDMRQAFIDMMQLVISDLIKDETGVRPEWRDQEPAPEHERAGNA